jgi:hypothetical protein
LIGFAFGFEKAFEASIGFGGAGGEERGEGGDLFGVKR